MFYDLFHILLSLWHTNGTMVSMRACVCVCVCVCVCLSLSLSIHTHTHTHTHTHLGCTTNQKSFPFRYLQLVQCHQGSLVCFLKSWSWRSWYSRRQGVRRYNNWCTDIFGGLFEHVPEICLFHWWRFFLVKFKTSSLGITLFKCQIIRHQIKEIFLYLILNLFYKEKSMQYRIFLYCQNNV